MDAYTVLYPCLLVSSWVRVLTDKSKHFRLTSPASKIGTLITWLQGHWDRAPIIGVNSGSTHNVMAMFPQWQDSLNQCTFYHVTLVTRVKNIMLSTFQYFFKYLQLYFEIIYFDSSRYTSIHVFSRAQSNYTCIYVEVFSYLRTSSIQFQPVLSWSY